MNKRIVALLLAVALLAVGVSGCSSEPSESPESNKGGPEPVKNTLDTVGYFVFSPVSEERLDFFKTAGYNLLEYCDISWYYNPDQEAFAQYQKGLAENIKLAKQKGFKVYVILLSNLEQWTGDAAFGNGMGKMFDPADTVKMNERLGYIRQAVEAFKEADGFSLFAGDPGGVLGIQAEGGLEYYIQMSRDVRQIVREVAPHAEFNMNLWAVSQFIQAESDPWRVKFWLAEGTNGRKIIAENDLLSADIGIEIPGHDYYRTLALQLYGSTAQKPERNFPDAQDVQAIKAKGTTRYWGFAHSILPDISESLRVNTARIKYYIDQMRAAGMNGAVCGNTGFASQYLDVYAFARFANDPTLTVDQVMREYAGFFTDDDASADALTEILKYLNNYDAEQNELTEEYQLPPLETRFTDPQAARQASYRVNPTSEPESFLPEAATLYLGRIQNRLIEVQSTVRPADAPDTGALLNDFDTQQAGLKITDAPDGTAGTARLTPIPNGGYALAEGRLKEAVDAGAYAQYGYVQFDVYSEQDRIVRGYVMLGSDAGAFGANQFWYYDHGGSIQLKAGWNHVCVKLSKGSQPGKDPVAWNSLTNYRILFFCDDEQAYSVWLDNLYISNYQENKLPS